MPGLFLEEAVELLRIFKGLLIDQFFRLSCKGREYDICKNAPEIPFQRARVVQPHLIPQFVDGNTIGVDAAAPMRDRHLLNFCDRIDHLVQNIGIRIDVIHVLIKLCQFFRITDKVRHRIPCLFHKSQRVGPLVDCLVRDADETRLSCGNNLLTHLCRSGLNRRGRIRRQLHDFFAQQLLIRISRIDRVRVLAGHTVLIADCAVLILDLQIVLAPVVQAEIAVIQHFKGIPSHRHSVDVHIIGETVAAGILILCLRSRIQLVGCLHHSRQRFDIGVHYPLRRYRPLAGKEAGVAAGHTNRARHIVEGFIVMRPHIAAAEFIVEAGHVGFISESILCDHRNVQNRLRIALRKLHFKRKCRIGREIVIRNPPLAFFMQEIKFRDAFLRRVVDIDHRNLRHLDRLPVVEQLGRSSHKPDVLLRIADLRIDFVQRELIRLHQFKGETPAAGLVRFRASDLLVVVIDRDVTVRKRVPADGDCILIGIAGYGNARGIDRECHRPDRLSHKVRAAVLLIIQKCMRLQHSLACRHTEEADDSLTSAHRNAYRAVRSGIGTPGPVHRKTSLYRGQPVRENDRHIFLRGLVPAVNLILGAERHILPDNRCRVANPQGCIAGNGTVQDVLVQFRDVKSVFCRDDAVRDREVELRIIALFDAQSQETGEPVHALQHGGFLHQDSGVVPLRQKSAQVRCPCRTALDALLIPVKNHDERLAAPCDPIQSEPSVLYERPALVRTGSFIQLNREILCRIDPRCVRNGNPYRVARLNLRPAHDDVGIAGLQVIDGLAARHIVSTEDQACKAGDFIFRSCVPGRNSCATAQRKANLVLGQMAQNKLRIRRLFSKGRDMQVSAKVILFRSRDLCVREVDLALKRAIFVRSDLDLLLEGPVINLFNGYRRAGKQIPPLVLYGSGKQTLLMRFKLNRDLFQALVRFRIKIRRLLKAITELLSEHHLAAVGLPRLHVGQDEARAEEGAAVRGIPINGEAVRDRFAFIFINKEREAGRISVRIPVGRAVIIRVTLLITARVRIHPDFQVLAGLHAGQILLGNKQREFFFMRIEPRKPSLVPSGDPHLAVQRLRVFRHDDGVHEVFIGVEEAADSLDLRNLKLPMRGCNLDFDGVGPAEIIFIITVICFRPKSVRPGNAVLMIVVVLIDVLSFSGYAPPFIIRIIEEHFDPLRSRRIGPDMHQLIGLYLIFIDGQLDVALLKRWSADHKPDAGAVGLPHGIAGPSRHAGQPVGSRLHGYGRQPVRSGIVFMEVVVKPFCLSLFLALFQVDPVEIGIFGVCERDGQYFTARDLCLIYRDGEFAHLAFARDIDEGRLRVIPHSGVVSFTIPVGVRDPSAHELPPFCIKIISVHETAGPVKILDIQPVIAVRTADLHALHFRVIVHVHRDLHGLMDKRTVPVHRHADRRIRGREDDLRIGLAVVIAAAPRTDMDLCDFSFGNVRSLFPGNENLQRFTICLFRIEGSVRPFFIRIPPDVHVEAVRVGRLQNLEVKVFSSLQIKGQFIRKHRFDPVPIGGGDLHCHRRGVLVVFIVLLAVVSSCDDLIFPGVAVEIEIN